LYPSKIPAPLETGIADDTAAINGGVEFLASKKGCLFFPAGAYKTMAQITWTAHSTLCILGDSQYTNNQAPHLTGMTIGA
jgi:hypothetical protein